MQRVGQILEDTNITQWRWVPSKENPADLATKTPINSDVSMWFHCLKFLQDKKTNWPLFADKSQNIKMNCEYFSNWRRLYRAVSMFLLYIRKLKAKSHKTQLPREVSHEMLQKAKSICYLNWCNTMNTPKKKW